MKIIKISHRNLNAWLDFFDNRAFADHKEWKGCYCTYYFYPRYDNSSDVNNSQREYAKWLIMNNKMKGYLVYEDGKVVGWCNVGPKQYYTKLLKPDQKYDGIKAIVCFMIEEQYRGKGIATAILKRIVEDSKKDNTKAIEAYPNVKAKNEYSKYHGSLNMYLKEGFIVEKVRNTTKVKLEIKKDA